MNIAPYRAKLPDLPCRRKDMAEPSGQFRGKGTHTHGEKTVEVTFHTCGYKKKPPELLQVRRLQSKRRLPTLPL